jgi:Ca2+-binding EF-hand superfamily protein
MTFTGALAQRPQQAGPTGEVEFSDIITTMQKRLDAPPYAPNLTADEKAGAAITDIEGQSTTKDKKVDATEMQNYLKSLGVDVTLEQAQTFIGIFDEDGNKTLDQKELSIVYDMDLSEPPGDQGGGGPQGGQPGGGGGGGGGGGPSGASGATGMADFMQMLMRLLGIDDKDGLSEEEKKKLTEFVGKYAGADGQLDMTELAHGLKAEAAAGKLDISAEQIFSTLQGAEKQLKAADTDGKAGVSAEELLKSLETSADAEANT